MIWLAARPSLKWLWPAYCLDAALEGRVDSIRCTMSALGRRIKRFMTGSFKTNPRLTKSNPNPNPKPFLANHNAILTYKDYCN